MISSLDIADHSHMDVIYKGIKSSATYQTFLLNIACHQGSQNLKMNIFYSSQKHWYQGWYSIVIKI